MTVAVGADVAVVLDAGTGVGEPAATVLAAGGVAPQPATAAATRTATRWVATTVAGASLEG
jgi:hypothetical protein